LDRKDRLQFVQFVAFVESFVAVIVSSRPSILTFPSVQSLPDTFFLDFFLLNALLVIVGCMLAYLRILTEKTSGEELTDLLFNYFGLTIGMPFGGIIAEVLPVSPSYWVFLGASSVFGIAFSLLFWRRFREALAPPPTQFRTP
jgi:hypothetical protein